MRYPNIHSATFLSRPNRFIAQVEREGQVETVHVKNTGRCRELLVPGSTVYLVESDVPTRKTRFDLVAVEKQRQGQLPLLVNMDAQAPNQVFGEWIAAGKLISGVTKIQPEHRFGSSRFDFYVEAGAERHFIEVKGVTLEEDGRCRFPDAPTERGRKHLDELAACMRQGYQGWLCFVVQMDGMRSVTPNDVTDPAFGQAMRRAKQAGVLIRAYGCQVTPDSLTVVQELPVLL